MSTPISGIVNRTGVDLFRAAGSTVAAAALGSGAWLEGGGDVVAGLVDASPVVVLPGTDGVLAPGLPEQAETMVVARSATTAIDRPGRWRWSQGNDSKPA